MHKKVPILVGIIVLVIIAFFFFRSGGDDYKITNHPSHDGPIVAFGDSLVQGVGAKVGGGFVDRLSEKIGEPIINLGRGGDTTKDGLERLPFVLNENPRMVLLLLGGNDFLGRVPKEETFTNLRTIINRIQKNGAVVVVIGVRGGVLYDSYDDAYEELARDTGSLYVSDVLDGLLGDSQYMDDAIHPNDEGYAIISERVLAVIQDYI